MLNHQKESLLSTSESGLLHLNQKGMESGHHGFIYVVAGGHMILGSWMAPKVPRSIYGVEHGKPNAFPEIVGRNLAREDEGVVGRGNGKKRKVTCNE